MNMANSYIVDTFLSGSIWVMLAFMFFDIMARVKEINAIMPKHILALAVGAKLKTASYFSIPFLGIWAFLCWRFVALMIESQTFGVGGIGLIAILGVAGAIMIWVTLLLIVIKHSRYADAGAVAYQQSAMRPKPQLDPLFQG
ncbi:MAG: hypothetical protein Q4P13_05965 [Psychrobacter sp.]|nr:hypothetical protein [Psychrobacter sp.]